jgi:alpha-L-fucosidase 2
MRALACVLLAAAAACAADLRTDIEYGKAGAVSLKLDASIPEGKGPFPAVILVHGGGWRNGDKATYVKPVFKPLSDAGFAWFSINYRMAPDHIYPAAVDDLVTAVRWLKQHAREYHVDPKRIALCGESAGGQLVALVGARYGKQLGVRAVVPVYPPTDMEELHSGREKTPAGNQAINGFLGLKGPGPEATKLLREASPVTWVKRDMPPYLLIHGTGDKTVPYSQSTTLQAKMKAAGAKCDLFTVEGAPHGWGAWEKDPAMRKYQPYLIDWLKRTMRVR